MKANTKDGIVTLVGIIALFCAILAATIAIASAGCSLRWKDSGIVSKWEIGAGCRLYVNGAWVPERAYRDVR